MNAPQLDLIPAPEAPRTLTAGVDRLLAILHGRRWLHATGIVTIQPDWTARRVRELAAAAGGRIIGLPKSGYCRTDEARPEEIRHCLASLQSRLDCFANRAQAIWKHINRPYDQELELIFPDEATQAVHRVLLLERDGWLKADAITLKTKRCELKDCTLVQTAPGIPERKIQNIAENSDGWIIGHPAKGYRHAMHATDAEKVAAYRGLMARVRALEKRLREIRGAAHGALAA